MEHQQVITLKGRKQQVTILLNHAPNSLCRATVHHMNGERTYVDEIEAINAAKKMIPWAIRNLSLIKDDVVGATITTSKEFIRDDRVAELEEALGIPVRII